MNSLPLWTSSEIAAATNGRATSDFVVTGISIDSRAISPGDLFIALKGPNFDGHDFIGAAFKAGASGAIVASNSASNAASSCLIVVEDTMEALNGLASAARKRTKARILAVTGSVGKTSTKEMLAHSLNAYGKSYASSGNLNNQWGAPLSLSRLPRDAGFGVFELGMNHAGEISPLSKLVKPLVAIITWVSAAHLEFFDSVDAIARAKAEIFDGMSRGGKAILPRDNPHFALLAEFAVNRGLDVISFGSGDGADCRLAGCVVTPKGNEVTADIHGRRVGYSMANFGRHQAINSLAALSAIQSLGLSIEPALGALGELEPLPGRGKREIVHLRDGSIVLIDESYNASPASMRAALDVLAATPTAKDGRRIVVLGDMREMGSNAPEFHRALASDVIGSGAELAFLVGPLMRTLDDALPKTIVRAHAPDSQAMVKPLISRLRAGDVVLIKGSLGTRMAPLVAAVRALGVDAPPLLAGNGH